ncbi:MAG: LacI family DNA-binding transcriptional regulator [Rhodocyclaceae bacterium]|nr:transcriptional regulator [Sphingomonas sp.]
MEALADYKAGREKPRQSDVAKRAGVSPSTVSKVINGGPGISAELRGRVMQAAQEIGFHIAELRPAAVERGAYRIKLITNYQFLTYDGNYFHAEVIQSVLAECERAGIEIDTVLLDRDHQNDMEKFWDQIRSGAAEGVILVGVDMPPMLEVVRALGVPVVMVNGNDPNCQFDSVMPAFRDGSRIATRYLIEQGHRDIVHVTHLYRPLIRRRLDGFREALEEAGLPFSFERNVIDISSGHFSAEQAASVVAERIANGTLNATALFCVSDYTAFGVVQGILRSGKTVPGDYSVASFDDLPLAQLCRPALTSVGVDRRALGRIAVERLLSRLESVEGPTLRIEVGARLTIRDSTRPV